MAARSHGSTVTWELHGRHEQDQRVDQGSCDREEKRMCRCLHVVADRPDLDRRADGAIAKEIDLSKAVVVVPDGLSGPENKATRLLVEEVRKRSHIELGCLAPLADPRRAGHRGRAGPACSTHSRVSSANSFLPSPSERRKKDFASRRPPWARARRSWPSSATTSAVYSSASDVCSASCTWRPGGSRFPTGSTWPPSPKYPLRGHQLGYRPKTNSYDAWDVAQWDQYIRDLAVFGTNAIELIPPRSDDAANSPHFPLPPLEMMAQMSQIAADYGLDVWIWYPAMDADYADPKTVEHALAEWAEVFKKLPRIDAVFVPGGDPGHTRPGPLHGPSGKAGRQPAALPSRRPDVGFASEFLSSLARRVSRDLARRAGLAGRSRLRPANAGEPAPVAKGRPRPVPDPRLPRYHPQPALPVRRFPTGTWLTR